MISARGGFTLVEVALAMGLFLVGITGLLGLFQFGGGLEASARSYAELAPAIEPLVKDLRRDAWLLDATGTIAGIREIRGEPVPGAPGYHYNLEVDALASLPRAVIRFYRSSPDRIEASAAFLLPPEVPLQRRLNAHSP